MNEEITAKVLNMLMSGCFERWYENVAVHVRGCWWRACCNQQQGFILLP
jgi:hypothetical protein